MKFYSNIPYMKQLVTICSITTNSSKNYYNLFLQKKYLQEITGNLFKEDMFLILYSTINLPSHA